MKTLFAAFIIIMQTVTYAQAPRVTTRNGSVEGVAESGIYVFKGIPFAAPPVGTLRWKEPQPVKSWPGIRRADKFGPRAMQRPLFGDMQFRSDSLGEDCLYLNVWTPTLAKDARLPVLVYFYGGGLMAGDGSEPRYDGESMARHGIVSLTVNYRLNLFGFLAHPELTKESPNRASGNYGLLDQAAALKWVQQNIAAFGGDPTKVTIAGESAGSISVSAQMASPLSKNLIAGAIGESGSVMGSLSAVPLAEGEKAGLKFAELAGAKSLAELRAMPANKLLEASANREWQLFHVTVDGYFFPKRPVEIYEKGEQAKVPLLLGWNSEEMNYGSILGQDPPTKANYEKAVKRIYGDNAADILKVYAATTDDDVLGVATDLAGDGFIGFSTWKWSDLQSRTGGKPVYRYMYARPRPLTKEEASKAKSQTDQVKNKRPPGAVHSAEIEYAMGNLPSNRVFDWQPEDYKVSQIMQTYFVNFIKTGNPNGLGVVEWPSVKSGGPAPVMIIDVTTRVEIEKNRERYLVMDKVKAK